MTANDLTNRLLIAIPRDIPGARCWRRNVGSGYPVTYVQGALRMLAAGAVAQARDYLRRARPIRFGLDGEPDIDGFLPDGRRLGCEIKVGRDTQSQAQITCQRIYEQAGCVYVVATDAPADPVAACVEEILALYRR